MANKKSESKKKFNILETKNLIKGEFIEGSVNGIGFKLEVGSECTIDEELATVVKEAGFSIEEVTE